MPNHLILAGLLTFQLSASDSVAPDPLTTLRQHVDELLRRKGLSPLAIEPLQEMKQDLQVLEAARTKTKKQLPNDYRRELANHEALLRSLRVETLSKEDFNTLMDLASDLWAKAEYAKHGSDAMRHQAGKAPLYHVALAPNGMEVIASDGFQLKRWDVATGRVLWDLPSDKEERVSALARADDRLFAGTSQGTIKVISSESGKVLSTKQVGPKVDWLAASLPDELVVGRKDGTLDVWRRKPELVPLREVLKNEARQPTASVSPDGKWLCVPASSKEVIVVSLTSPEKKKTLTVEGGNVAVARFTPDGRQICAVGRDGHVTVWDWPVGKKVRNWENKQPFSWDAAISPDGKFLAIASGFRDQRGQVRLWDLAQGKEFKTANFTSAVNVLSFSDDGKSLVTGHHDGSWRVWTNWISLYPFDPFRPVPVQVRTLRGGEEKKGYEVFFRALGHRDDPPPHPRLRTISSPAKGEIPAGKYILWASNGTLSTEKRVIAIDSRSNDPIDLMIP